MNKQLLVWTGLGVFAIGLLATVPGCVGMHGTQATLDALQSAVGESSKPVVEAFIEYAGPEERWAGPTSLVVHVVARDGVDPTITLSPNTFQPEAGIVDFSSPMTAKRSGLTTTLVRDRLAIVSASMIQTVNLHEDPTPGCLSPIRARLIRVDGTILEKRGCRGQTGWTFQASDAATDLIAMAENGPPTRLPAATSKPEMTTPDTKAPAAFKKPDVPTGPTGPTGKAEAKTEPAKTVFPEHH